MGIIKLFKAFGEAKRAYDAEVNSVPTGLTSTLEGRAIRVWGTIYHQDVIAQLQSAVPVRIRPSKKSDRYGWYDYQVMLTNGTIVGALDQWAVERGQIKNWQALAYVEHGVKGEKDRHRLYIPYANIKPERWHKS